MVRKTWRPHLTKRLKHKVPETVKAHVQEKADHLIKFALKPEHIKPPPKENFLNYITDIYSKWYRSYFYFCAMYRCSAPNRISEFFESRFARLEYVGNERFNLSYMRHTGQWVELFADLSLDDCLESIKYEPHYLP
jgi:hypothetical protein